MKLLKALKKAFSRKRKLVVKLLNDTIIREAFVYKGVKYYMFNDPFEVTAGRGLYSMTLFEEMLMRLDREYMEYHVQAMDNIVNNTNKIELAKIIQLNENLKQRLAFKIATPDMVYKLASIIFFDETESPYRYDVDYCDKKVKEWSKDAEMYDFFLQTPLKQLIPFLELPKEGTQSYLTAVNKIKTRHLNYTRGLALNKT